MLYIFDSVKIFFKSHSFINLTTLVVLYVMDSLKIISSKESFIWGSDYTGHVICSRFTKIKCFNRVIRLGIVLDTLIIFNLLKRTGS